MHGGHLRGEEHEQAAMNQPEIHRRERRPRAWDDEGDHQREDDEEGGRGEEADLVAGQRQQHETDATTASDARNRYCSSGAMVSPYPSSCVQ